jgi:uncharacterized protein (UPF0212 family)
MEHEEIAGLACPKCGAALEYGFIAGHWVRLRWCFSEKSKNDFCRHSVEEKT